MIKTILFTSTALMTLLLVNATWKSVQYETRQFKAFNNIRFEYALFLPDQYDPDKTYSLVALLCETHSNDKAWSSTVEELEAIDLDQSIVIVPKVPLGEEHWGTHPIHHAFNDLLKSVRTEFGERSQKVHLIGARAGQEVAFWWTHDSSALIGSTSIINGTLWKQDHWDKRWYNNLTNSGVPLYAYEERVPDKFEMPAIHFRASANVGQVIDDIEERRRR